MRAQTRDTAGSTDGAGEQQRAYPSVECHSALPQRPPLAAPPTPAHSVPDSRLPERSCGQRVTGSQQPTPHLPGPSRENVTRLKSHLPAPARFQLGSAKSSDHLPVPTGRPSNNNSHASARRGLSRCRDISHHRAFPARCSCGEAVFRVSFGTLARAQCREIAGTNCRCSWERATCDTVCFARAPGDCKWPTGQFNNGGRLPHS